MHNKLIKIKRCLLWLWSISACVRTILIMKFSWCNLRETDFERSVKESVASRTTSRMNFSMPIYCFRLLVGARKLFFEYKAGGQAWIRLDTPHCIRCWRSTTGRWTACYFVCCALRLYGQQATALVRQCVVKRFLWKRWNWYEDSHVKMPQMESSSFVGIKNF